MSDEGLWDRSHTTFKEGSKLYCSYLKSSSFVNVISERPLYRFPDRNFAQAKMQQKCSNLDFRSMNFKFLKTFKPSENQQSVPK